MRPARASACIAYAPNRSCWRPVPSNGPSCSPHNDLPGVMLASSVSTYLHRYAVAPGERLVLFTTNDHAYRTAIDWNQADRKVAAVIDARPEPSGAWVDAASEAGIEVIPGPRGDRSPRPKARARSGHRAPAR